jgi:hypothetical protein
MLTLKNESLRVSVLDPVADSDRLGTRYCTGGFIFQIEDNVRGILLSGPTFPDSYNLFDGQGAPDAFPPGLTVEQDAEGSPSRVLGIGIGLIDPKADETLERCMWDIGGGSGALIFRTEQKAGPWSFQLARTLTLRGRTLRSETVLGNAGTRHLPFQWYPHPFFPLYPGGGCCRVSVPVTLPDNPGYELSEDGFLMMKNLPWTGNENHFQLLGHRGDRPVSFLQKHPITSQVSVSCDYIPARLPVWGNPRTFSFEPYYERNLTPQEEARWSITFDF